jgi:hypothetical protein
MLLSFAVLSGAGPGISQDTGNSDPMTVSRWSSWSPWWSWWWFWWVLDQHFDWDGDWTHPPVGAPSSSTDRPGATTGSSPSTTAPGTTAPSTTAPSTTAPSTTAPSTTSSTATSSTATSSTATSSTATNSPTRPSTPTQVPPGGELFIPYWEDSLFRKPLPDDTPVSATSAEGVAFAKANDPYPYLKIRGAHGVGWGIAYAMADCSDPIYRIGSEGNLPASQRHLRDVGFHAPASVWENIPPNDDGPFLVIDRCGTPARPGGLSVWGANTSVSGTTVTTSAAGSFAHDSNGLDSRNPASDSQLNERSRGVIPDSMAIRVDLLDQAIRNGTGLGHLLEVFWVETDSSAGVVSPMVGSEDGKHGYGAEGERFRIKAGIDLASRPGCSPETNPVGLAIARTLQEHGAYLGDNSGSGSGIKTEQNADYPGLHADSLAGCMTWDDIEFLPRGWVG